MSKVLLVGCSFLENFKTDNSKIKIIGVPGAGNQMLSAIVAHELATHHYESVYVLWTGISRLDTSVGLDLHRTFNSEYSYVYQLDDLVWYASGGISASGSRSPCPTDIQKLFHTYYVGSTKKILSEWSLSAVLSTQMLLESKQIPYKMGFIYNLHNPAYDGIDWLSNVLGTVDNNCNSYRLLNWEKIQIENNLLDWATKHNLLLGDNFHPKMEGVTQWLLENFNLNLSKLLD
jgi:hypothetical protein